MAKTLTSEQAAALANELSAAGRWPELESLVRAWLRTLPAEPSKSRDALERQLREKLIEALFRQGRVEESLAAFLDLARDTAPEISAPFVDLYVAAMKRTHAMPVPLGRFHRVHQLSRLVEESLALGGETAECGCFRGLSSYVICATERRHRPGYDGRSHHVFDSFAGLSAPQAEDLGRDDAPGAARVDGMRKAGAFKASLEEVRANLADFPAIDYRPGWIPDSLRGVAERSYRLLHLDLDLYAPTAGALEYFWPRLVAGAYVACDDYGWPGGRRAIDEFAQRNGVAVATNGFNQAWLRKPGGR
jgi:O-methyltransferase